MSDNGHSISAETCIVRATAARPGRTLSVAPGITATRHLHYGRILLSRGETLNFESGGRETGLICLDGSADVAVNGSVYRLMRYDSIYSGKGSSIGVEGGESGCDLAEVAAPVEGIYPTQFVRFADVQRDPALHFRAGEPSYQRQLNILIGNNVHAGRILAGVTFSAPGNWTSWPPHEHGAMLEEAYTYIDMPAPAWGLQLVYVNAHEPELVTVVREGDCVVMPAGYHPNVAAPGGTINFLWMMAAIREAQDRQFGVVNVQPEYAAACSGLGAARR